MANLIAVPSVLGEDGTPEGMMRTREVCRAAGVTPRQLRWWTDKGLLEAAPTPHQSGYARLWPASVVEDIRDLQRRIEACPFDH